MYENLAEKFCGYADTVLEVTETVQVPKGDLQQVYVAIAKLNDKIKDLESQNASLSRRARDLLAENDRLTQEFNYLRQQVDGLPPHTNGLKVRLPDGFHSRDGEDSLWGSCYAVLRPELDPAARAALYAYASTTGNIMTRHKILVWLGDETQADKPAAISAANIIGDALVARELRLAMDRGMTA